MAKLVYRDFDDFAESLVGISGRFIPTARSTAEWWREGVSPGRTGLRQMQIGGPATFAGDGEPGSYTLGLPMTDPTAIRIDGQPLEEDSFLFLHEDRPFTFTGQEVTRWAGITIPTDDASLTDHCLRQRRRSPTGPRVRSELAYLNRLRWTVERAISSGVNFQPPTAAVAIDEEISICLTHVFERTLAVINRSTGRPQFSRGRVIARTLALIEASEGQPLFIDDLCRATQVSERSLRGIFHEFFGVGPMRLIKLRQLREIHAALLRADPQRDTVTRVAARFGIWDFSLFAHNYKALFGESPSQTLRMPPSYVKPRSAASWLHYASKLFIDDMHAVTKIDDEYVGGRPRVRPASEEDYRSDDSSVG